MAGWIYGNRYLSQSEMENNAKLVQSFLLSRGWTNNAIAGVLGNMQSESGINPGIWQSLNEGNYSGGYGLVQWTPATNYIDWANANGYSITDGNAQLLWIDTQTTVVGQWIKTTNYNISFADFKKSTLSPEYLASAFLSNFDRPKVELHEQRQGQARTWYNYITGTSGGGSGGTPWVPKKRKGFKFIIFNRSKNNVI